jgi:hypothetical protein
MSVLSPCERSCVPVLVGRSLEDSLVRTLVILLAVLTVPASELHAQRGHRRYGVFVTHALSVRSPAHFVEPVRPGSIVFVASLPFVVRPWWSLEYSLGVIPLAWVRRSVVGDPPTRERSTSFGVGVRPVELRAALGSRRVTLEASIAGAVLRYGQPTPTLDAANTNFLGSASVGLRVQSLGLDISAGYRRAHMSNGGRADFNPGIDSNEIYLGVWFP